MSENIKSERTKLQGDLHEKMLNRSYQEVSGIIAPGFEREDELSYRDGLEGEVFKRAAGAMRNGEHRPEVTILDAGCGSGAAIEEIARTMPYLTRYLRIKIKAIGIDLNPLPELIDPQVLRIYPRNACFESESGRPIADIHTDDVTTLATIPSDSVDILYSVNCLSYVEDTLRALESGWRVLKPDGLMIWHATYNTLSSPPFIDVLAQTPGAEEVFSIRDSCRAFSDWPSPDILVGRKKTESGFQNFPFVLDLKNKTERMGTIDNHYQHVKVGNYIRLI